MISYFSKRQNYHKLRTCRILITLNLAVTSRHFNITFPLIRVFMRSLFFRSAKKCEDSQKIFRSALYLSIYFRSYLSFILLSWNRYLYGGNFWRTLSQRTRGQSNIGSFKIIAPTKAIHFVGLCILFYDRQSRFCSKNSVRGAHYQRIFSIFCEIHYIFLCNHIS